MGETLKSCESLIPSAATEVPQAVRQLRTFSTGRDPFPSTGLLAQLLGSALDGNVTGFGQAFAVDQP
jgi:hypothetical protein